MIFESVISTVATLIAAGYAAHKIENVFLARRGYDTRNFFKPDPLPAPEPTLAVPLWTIEDDRRQAQAFIDCPTAFWLDPNFFGDDPNWRERLFPPPRDEYGDTPLPVIYGRSSSEGVILGYIDRNKEMIADVLGVERGLKAPPSPPAPCPTCHTGRRMVLTDHGGEATSWACVDCDTEFTRAGETRTSKKRRKKRNLLANRDDYDTHLPLPPSME
jgi:hypothetical protein